MTDVARSSASSTLSTPAPFLRSSTFSTSAPPASRWTYWWSTWWTSWSGINLVSDGLPSWFLIRIEVTVDLTKIRVVSSLHHLLSLLLLLPPERVGAQVSPLLLGSLVLDVHHDSPIQTSSEGTRLVIGGIVLPLFLQPWFQVRYHSVWRVSS